MRFTRFMSAAVAVSALTLGLASCSTSDAVVTKSDATSSTYPMSIVNCGQQITIDAPPVRAVSLNQGSTEILLSLGLVDRMVGTATWTDPVRENLAADNARVPRLSENKPSFEVVLDTEPDFVSASFASTIAEGGVAGRDQFAALGVPTYLSPTDNGCNGKASSASNADGARTEPLKIDTVYKEIRDLAAIFDVSERGEQLVTELQDRFAAASDAVDASGVSLAFWFADTTTPYMAGCCGSSGIITESVGAENVFADTTDEWPQVSWETILDRNPTALVLADLSRRSIDGDALASKIAFLESNPVTSRMQAVQDKKYIVVNGADLNPSIRTIDGVEKTATALNDWVLAN